MAPHIHRYAWPQALVLLLAGSALDAQDQEYPTSRPGPGADPTRVEFGVAVFDVTSIDSASQSFTADVGLVLRWRDPRLASPGGEPRIVARALVWNPDVNLLNQRDVAQQLDDTVDILPDGTVLYRQRFTGEFSNRIHVADFPFDAHDFRLQFVAARYGPGAVRFENGALKDRTGIVDSPLVVDWEVRSWRIDTTPYASKLIAAPRAAFALELHAVRLSGFFVMKLLLPLALVVLMSWAVFWLDPERVDAQVGMAATAVLTLIAYRFAFDSLLPRVSYMTRVDYFISGSTLLVFLALLQVLVTGAYVGRGRTDVARRIDAHSRIAFPLAFALLTAWSFL